MPVDIGEEAIDGNANRVATWTVINRGNPATISGRITSIDIWADVADITGLRVGTFYTTNGNTLKCRASEAIAGAITVGSKVTKTGLTIAVEIGDYIGCYFTGGWLELQTTGLGGVWSFFGERIDPDDEAVYSLDATHGNSLGGYISEGWAGGDVNGVAIAGIAKINGVALADITKVNGVA